VRPVCALDTVVGADGIHSVVREIRLGREEPHFTRRVAYRTTFPAARRGELKLDGNTKWWALTCGPWWPYPMGPREANLPRRARGCSFLEGIRLREWTCRSSPGPLTAWQS
jgi:2-polyprenyl-6-methoxyphenol hydroxylase-like FAD-dependent oxidoreductase